MNAMTQNDVLNNMIEVQLVKDDDFLKVRETLERIGIPSKQTKELFQSCHILHKRGKYYLCHFKELFGLDGRTMDISEQDYARRNKIIQLLQEWNMIKLDKNTRLEPMGSVGSFKIVKHSERDQWKLSPKYRIGVRK